MKSVADYSSNIAFKGACCYSSSTTPVEEYYNTCISNRGIWDPMEPGNDITDFDCPDVGATGCCCSCKYVGSSILERWDGLEDPGFRGASGFFNNYSEGSDNCLNYENSQGYNFPCYQGGLKDNVTFCECADNGGVWAEGVSCSVYTGATCGNWDPDANEGNGECVGNNYISIGAEALCTRQGSNDDVRWPGACCNSANSTCDDACDSKHCAEFRDSYNAVSGNFASDYYCVTPIGIDYPNYPADEPQECPEPTAYSFFGGGDDEEEDPWLGSVYDIDPRTKIYMDSSKNKSSMKDFARRTGSTSRLKSGCVYIQKNNGIRELVCGNLVKSACEGKKNGMWAGFNEENQPILCDTDACNEIERYIQNKQQLDRATINSWEIGERRLNLPGRYLGELYMKDDVHGQGIPCEGSISTGKSQIYYPVDKDNTSNSEKSFAIFIADSDFQYRKFSKRGWNYDSNKSKKNVKDSSSWDSDFNTSHNRHLSLVKKIDKSYNKNQIHEHKWQIPSKVVLSLMKNRANQHEFFRNTTDLDKHPNSSYTPMIQNNTEFYWSSTFYKSNKVQMAYCQSFGNNSMVALSHIDKLRPVRLVMVVPIIENPL